MGLQTPTPSSETMSHVILVRLVALRLPTQTPEPVAGARPSA